MAQTLADFFDGKVNQSHYSQAISVVAGEGRYVGVYETQRFTFTGVPSSLAHSTASVTLTDLDGKTYTFEPQHKFVDASTGSAVFPKTQVKVTRARMSLHMWILTVERTGAKLYQNGVRIKDGPTWMDNYNNDRDMT